MSKKMPRSVRRLIVAPGTGENLLGFIRDVAAQPENSAFCFRQRET